jgi:hypothetical protein
MINRKKKKVKVNNAMLRANPVSDKSEHLTKCKWGVEIFWQGKANKTESCMVQAMRQY